MPVKSTHIKLVDNGGNELISLQLGEMLPYTRSGTSPECKISTLHLRQSGLVVRLRFFDFVDVKPAIRVERIRVSTENSAVAINDPKGSFRQWCPQPRTAHQEE